MLAHHLFGVAEQFRHVARGYARLLQQDAGESVPESMRSRLLAPRPAKTPQPVELAPPNIGYDVHVLCRVRPENERPVEIYSQPDALLQPFRYPGTDLSAGLRGTDVAFSVLLQAVDVKGADIGYAKARVHRYGNEIAHR